MRTARIFGARQYSSVNNRILLQLMQHIRLRDERGASSADPCFQECFGRRAVRHLLVTPRPAGNVRWSREYGGGAFCILTEAYPVFWMWSQYSARRICLRGPRCRNISSRARFSASRIPCVMLDKALFVGPVVLSVFYDLLVAWIAAGRKVGESDLPAPAP